MARALYIHWPFCLAKCPYCDFNSHVRAKVEHEEWQAALLADLRHEARFAGGEKLDSIFFGGGTPSLMPPALVAALIKEAERCWGFAADIEITLEANPSSVEAARFADLARAGVNRVSLGVQALDDAALRFLGRLHDAREGLAALAVAQAAFARVSLDLIYARPGQSQQGWHDELARALMLGTEHLSLYQLTIEPGTRFETLARRGDLAMLDEDAAADLYHLTADLTSAAGLPAYEISNHARAGAQSRHNLAYWRYQDYCGIGPGAHGRRGAMATIRHRKPENWLAAIARTGSGILEERALPAREQAAEALLMGLRLAEGVAPARLAARLGLAHGDLLDGAKVAQFVALGLLWQSGAGAGAGSESGAGERLGVTQRGMPLLDAILADVVHADLVAA